MKDKTEYNLYYVNWTQCAAGLRYLSEQQEISS